MPTAFRPPLVAALALASLTAACASGGRGGGASLPVVSDPAPIVSGTMRPYRIAGRLYQPAEDPDYEEVGMASWYGGQHHGRATASGERFDMNALSAAHKTLPLPGLVEVTNLETGRSAVVRLNDRGPFSDGRIIDLSRAAAEEIGMLAAGVARVRVRYLGPAPRQGGAGPVRQAGHQAARAEPPHRGRGDNAIWVQAGAFSERDNARRAAERLGGDARVDDVRSGGRRLYRVLVGPWSDANAAERRRMAVVAEGFSDAMLISGDSGA